MPTTTRSWPFGSSAPSRRRRVPETGSRPVLGLTQFLSCGAHSVPAACLHASFPQDVLLDLAVFRAGKLRDNVDEARDGELLQPRLAEGCDLRRMGNLRKYMPVTFVTMMIGQPASFNRFTAPAAPGIKSTSHGRTMK